MRDEFRAKDARIAELEAERDRLLRTAAEQGSQLDAVVDAVERTEVGEFMRSFSPVRAVVGLREDYDNVVDALKKVEAERDRLGEALTRVADVVERVTPKVAELDAERDRLRRALGGVAILLLQHRFD